MVEAHADYVAKVKLRMEAAPDVTATAIPAGEASFQASRSSNATTEAAAKALVYTEGQAK